jgi:hypothetical protein
MVPHIVTTPPGVRSSTLGLKEYTHPALQPPPRELAVADGRSRAIVCAAPRRKGASYPLVSIWIRLIWRGSSIAGGRGAVPVLANREEYVRLGAGKRISRCAVFNPRLTMDTITARRRRSRALHDA